MNGAALDDVKNGYRLPKAPPLPALLGMPPFTTSHSQNASELFRGANHLHPHPPHQHGGADNIFTATRQMIQDPLARLQMSGRPALNSLVFGAAAVSAAYSANSGAPTASSGDEKKQSGTAAYDNNRLLLKSRGNSNNSSSVPKETTTTTKSTKEHHGKSHESPRGGSSSSKNQ